MLNRVAQGLLSTHPAQRQSCVDSWIHWLSDGQGDTLEETAAVLGDLIRDTELGFSLLTQALTELGATGEVGKAGAALLALEQRISSVAGFPPRKQSLALDHASGAADETGGPQTRWPGRRWNSWRRPRKIGGP